MTIASGTSASYYSCGDAKKRGICANRTMLREDAVRTAILRSIRDALFTPDAVAFLRKRIAERLRAIAQTGNAELEERAQRFRRTEERIHGLVSFIASGDESKYVRDTLRDLEAQARIDSAAIEELSHALRAPVALPTPDALLGHARDLETVLAADPVRAREALRGLFVNGRIEMRPQNDGSYIACATFLPLVAMATAGTSAMADAHAASVTVPLQIPVPKPPDRRRKT